MAYAGQVPWADAVADPRNPRQITVMADGQSMHGTDICGLPIERPIVHSSAATVSILVAGYGRPLAPAVSCGEPGIAPQPVRVTLPSPPGRRALIDVSTGLRHWVLNPAAVPSLGVRLSPGYVAAPISWQDRTGLVTRQWSSGACATQCMIQLRYAPPTSHASFDQFGGMSLTGHAAINGSRATIYSYRERRGDLLLTETALVWSRPDRSRIVLTAGGGVRGNQPHPPSESQTIRLARSIR